MEKGGPVDYKGGGGTHSEKRIFQDHLNTEEVGDVALMH